MATTKVREIGISPIPSKRIYIKKQNAHLVTPIYWLTCQYTGKLFCSPNYREKYSPEGKRLKDEHWKLEKEARKLSCRVYFRKCKMTGEWFTTQKISELYSAEGHRIVRERQLEWQRRYRKTEKRRDYERERNKQQKRKEYQKQWHEAKIITKKGDWAFAKRSCPVFFLTCKHTGTLFTSRTKSERYCPEYRQKRERIIEECKGLGNAEIARRLAILSYAARFRPRQVKCKCCGKEFATEYKKSHIFCSKECSKAHSRAVRSMSRNHKDRAKRKGVKYEPVNPLSVFRRDKWKCQLCGRSTPRTKRGTTHDNAPELDHIIPFALGGEHTYANTQTACRKCNWAKGATASGQLRLAI